MVMVSPVVGAGRPRGHIQRNDGHNQKTMYFRMAMRMRSSYVSACCIRMLDADLSTEKTLNSWTSSVYDHFNLPPAIKKDADGAVKYAFTCKRYAVCFASNGWHPCVAVSIWCLSLMEVCRLFKQFWCCSRHGSTHTHSCKDNSTSNLRGHAEKCDLKAVQERNGAKQPKINKIASKYTNGEFRYLMVEWLTQCHWPNIIIKDIPLQKIFCLLNPAVNIHSDTTAGHDIKEVYEVLKEQLKQMLKVNSQLSHMEYMTGMLQLHDLPVLAYICSSYIK